MKRNLEAPILDLDGKPLPDEATLKSVLFLAVTTPQKDDDRLDVKKKLELYSLAQKVHAGGEVDFTAEEIAALKDRVAKVFVHVVVVGRTFELLESDPQ